MHESKNVEKSKSSKAKKSWAELQAEKSNTKWKKPQRFDKRVWD